VYLVADPQLTELVRQMVHGLPSGRPGRGSAGAGGV